MHPARVGSNSHVFVAQSSSTDLTKSLRPFSSGFSSQRRLLVLLSLRVCDEKCLLFYTLIALFYSTLDIASHRSLFFVSSFLLYHEREHVAFRHQSDFVYIIEHINYGIYYVLRSLRLVPIILWRSFSAC